MEGFNPWIDIAVIGGFMALLIVLMVVSTCVNKRQSSAPRGATRVTQ